mmetsp:Transcript_27677/g.66684  ORF Transcript_27677/g.66684 Transcript_27677/m.66684 type:complete len:100 (-) Transcript_27677:527-826(-)
MEVTPAKEVLPSNKGPCHCASCSFLIKNPHHLACTISGTARLSKVARPEIIEDDGSPMITAETTGSVAHEGKDDALKTGTQSLDLDNGDNNENAAECKE